MAKPISELLKKTSPKVKADAAVKAAKVLTQMSLAELRKSTGLTQTDIADSLGIQQPNVSELEKRSDLYISTLKNYLHALGGELEIVASFPDGSKVEITQFSERL